MYNKPLKNRVLSSRGITLIEILMVLAVLAVLLSFALPSFSGPVVRAEMKAAVENVEYSLDLARNTARMTETSVALELISSPDGEWQAISYSSTTTKPAATFSGMQDYRLPPDIELVSDRDSFVFDARGLVDKPGQIILVSKLDESITSTVDVE